MLGKLIKHEFRATGRVMLPILAAVLLLAVMANVSIRLMDAVDSTFLHFVFGLVIFLFVIGMIAAAIMTIVIMVSRFYRNLLKDEGYLMHTLPVSVHELIWSKLIVSFVWFVVTFLVIFLVILLTGLLQSGTNLAEIFVYVPSWAEIKEALAQFGITPGTLIRLGAEFIVGAILSCVVSCLHFYAAMSLGHMFSKDKVLLSIVFFVAINFVFSMLSSGIVVAAATGTRFFEQAPEMMETVAGSLRFTNGVMLRAMLLEAVQGVILYVITVLGLKKGLNLA